MNGLVYYIGWPNWINPVNGHANPGSVSPVRLASITDGTSNTMAFGERAHGLYSQQVSSDGYTDFYDYNWWFSPNFGDTMFTTFYPINPWRKLQNTTTYGNQGDAYVLGASSFHPGGANFAFADGSVKFLKDTINSWPYDPVQGIPTNVTTDANGMFILAPNTQGVYQALSTRNGGEVISADSPGSAVSSFVFCFRKALRFGEAAAVSRFVFCFGRADYRGPSVRVGSAG